MKQFFLFITLVLGSLAAGAQGGTGSAIAQDEAVAALAAHNKIRAEVGTEPLRWSADLAAFAQAWADHLAQTGCNMQHRPSGGQWAQQYGENLFWGNGTYFSPTDATSAWYSEKKDFRYGPVTATNFSRIGHYTQMIWSGTTELGMGAARCRSGAWLIVANYSPRGNYVNVKPY